MNELNRYIVKRLEAIARMLETIDKKKDYHMWWKLTMEQHNLMETLGYNQYLNMNIY